MWPGDCQRDPCPCGSLLRYKHDSLLLRI
ncbi:SEC-C domain-containing protein [Aeromonas bestiarum]|nr:SEC-C domain-containing protein [Aeromonas bestiarum]